MPNRKRALKDCKRSRPQRLLEFDRKIKEDSAAKRHKSDVFKDSSQEISLEHDRKAKEDSVAEKHEPKDSIDSGLEIPLEHDHKAEEDSVDKTHKSDQYRVHWELMALWRTIKWRLLGVEFLYEAQYVVEEIEDDFGLTGDKMRLTRYLLREKILKSEMSDIRGWLWDNAFETRDYINKLEELKRKSRTILDSIEDNITDLVCDDLCPSPTKPSYKQRNKDLWNQLADLDLERQELEKKKMELESERIETLKTYEEKTYALMKVIDETQRVYIEFSDLLYKSEGETPCSAPGLLFF